MSLIVNGTTVSELVHNGTSLGALDFNGTRVFEGGVEPTQEGVDKATWEEIQRDVRAGKGYKFVGLHKQIDLKSMSSYDNRKATDDEDFSGVYKVSAQEATVYFVNADSSSLTFWIGDYQRNCPSYYMNSSYTNIGSWRDSEMRSWLHNTVANHGYYAALPSDLKTVMGDVTIKTGDYYNESTLIETTDKLYLPAPKELKIGSGATASEIINAGYSISTEYNTLSAWQYIPVNGGSKINYSILNNRMYFNSAHSRAVSWWLRSPEYNEEEGARFCYVAQAGDANSNYSNRCFGVFPAGCIK